MFYRTTDLDLFMHTMAPHLPIRGLEPKEWLENPNNYCLTDEEANLSLFEETDLPWMVDGHYFYNARGKKAVKTAKEALEFMFTKTPVEVIRGYTPHDNKGALWMSRHLGFKSYGTVELQDEPYELFILTKKEYIDNE